MTGRGRLAELDPRVLLAVPAAAYLLSYLELAVYHRTAWLWDTVVHENGRYTLLETTLYASHFLGHVPVLLTISLAAAGSWRAMSPPVATAPSRRRTVALATALIVLLVGSAVLAVTHFGADDTLAFVRQLRQRPDLDVRGGSWNLHLGSTMLQLALIPGVVWLVRRLWARPVVPSRDGGLLLAAAAVLVVAVTIAANDDPAAALVTAWTDPRYLAHSVRELLTFPVTYYPIPLAFLLAAEGRVAAPAPRSRRLDAVVLLLLAAFAAAFAYQAVVPLAGGIGELAQRPTFAHGGRLSIPYLLASHAFEHVLDSVFFTLLTLLLAWRRKPVGAES